MKKSLLLTSLFWLSGVTAAAEWNSADFSVYSLQYDSGTSADIYIEALPHPQSESLPYNIDVTLQLKKGRDLVFTNTGSGSYTQVSKPDLRYIQTLTLQSALHNALYADFDGNGRNDLLLQAQQTGVDSLLLLDYEAGSVPVVLQAIRAGLGVLIDAASEPSIQVADVNGDGRADVSLSGNRVLYADSDGSLLPVVPLAGCSIGTFSDLDCDGTIDQEDPNPLDKRIFTDTDLDGIADGIDANLNGQLDANEINDPDIDNDGIPNGSDSHVYSASNGEVTSAIPGSFSVSDTGKATYQIPITVVPGPANSAPELALSYNHGAGNGPVGVGWYLEGMSQITRCPATIAQDGFGNGVNFNKYDAFCLNGERLIAIQGAYGAANTEYRTENESFSKIISRGSAGSGPLYFEVRTASGDVEWYGNTASSRRLSLGGNVLTWALNRRQDQEGNGADYSYYNQNDDFYILSISYNGDRVDFGYEARPDVTVQYRNNTKTSGNSRLKTIRTYDNSSLVRTYTLNYVVSQLGSSLFKYLDECVEVPNSATPNCRARTTFGWDKGLAGQEGSFSGGSTLTDTSYGNAASFQTSDFHIGDVNGDGKSDVVYTYEHNGQLGWAVYLARSDGGGFLQSFKATYSGYSAGLLDSVGLTQGAKIYDRSVFFMGDFNGDGRSDLVWVGRSGNTMVRHMFLANASGTAFVSQGYEVDVSDTYIDLQDGQMEVGDTNGDGRSDLIWRYRLSAESGYVIYQATNRGSGLSLAKVGGAIDPDYTYQYFELSRGLLGDINGDGKTDLVNVFIYSKGSTKNLYYSVSLADNAGDSFTKVSLVKTPTAITSTTSNHDFALGDINGDGKDDLIWRYADGANVTAEIFWASQKGLNFDRQGSMSLPGDALQQTFGKISLVDINGDDRRDLLHTYKQSGVIYWHAYTANMNGKGFTLSDQDSRNSSLNTAIDYYFTDVSGDGKADMIWLGLEANNILARAFPQPQSYPDHIQSINNGLGKVFGVQYGYLSSQSGFVRAGDMAYPIRSDNGLGYLVSQHSESDGVGGTNTWSYSYEAPRSDLSGRGFLGFARRTITDLQSQIKTTEEYWQTFPVTGLRYLSEKRTGSNVLFELEFSHWLVSAQNSGKTQFPYLKDQVNRRFNLTDGSEESSVLAINTYSSADIIYGRPTQTQSITGRGFTAALDLAITYNASDISNVQQSITQTNDYSQSTSVADWRIRFIDSETTVYASADALNTETVVKRYTPYSTTSYLTRTETLFEGSNVELTRTFTRDGFGNVIQTDVSGTDPINGTIVPRSHSVNQYIDGIYPESITNEEGHTTRTYYDSATGDLVSVIDPNGLATRYRFDGFGRLEYQRNPDGSVLQKVYRAANSGNEKYSVTTSLSHSQESNNGAPDVTRYYDILNREIRSVTRMFSSTAQAAPDSVVDTTYDKRGRVVSQTQPYQGSPFATTYQYDDLDRVILESRPDGGSTGTQYQNEAARTRTVVTNSVVNAQMATYPGSVASVNKTLTNRLYHNALGQIVEHVDAASVSSLYRYTAQGDLRWVEIDGNAATTVTLAYDLAGNRTQLNDPNTSQLDVEFDALGQQRRLTQVGSPSQVTITDYDKIGRMIRRDDNDGSNSIVSTWEYDQAANGIGLLNLVSGPDYEQVLSYDGLSRLNSKSIRLEGEAQAKQFRYTYNHFSQRLDTIYPGGLATRTAYDAWGYKESISQVASARELWRAQKYDAWGRVEQQAYGNGVVQTIANNLATGRVSGINSTGPSTIGNIQSLYFAYDSAGNLLARQRTNPASGIKVDEFFAYDNLHRLKAADTSGLPSGARSITFQYDNLGNIKTKSDVSDVDGFSYGAGNAGPHAVTSVTKGSTTRNYQYDFKGNISSRDGDTILYTVFNKPYSIVGGNKTTTFKYGPDHNRFYQQSNNNSRQIETRYYGDDFEVITDGNERREKIYIEDFLVISKVGNNSMPASTWAYSYLHRDHLGSIDAVTDETGNIEAAMAFDPWGARRKDDWENADPAFLAGIYDQNLNTTTRGFTGHEMLDVSGLIHMNGRVYEPSIGRFLTPDTYIQMPENSQSYNRYSYVMNNPLSYTDPNGEFIPLLIYGAVAAYKAYNAYDTVVNGAQEVKTLISESSSSQDKLAAGLSLASRVVGTKKFTQIGGKLVSKFKAWKTTRKAGGKAKPSSSNPQSGRGGDKKTDSSTTQKQEVEQPGDISDRAYGTHRELKNAGASDSHHVIQDAAVKDIPGYNRMDAPAIQLKGPSTAKGSEHYIATQVQRQRGGGTYAAERRIGYKALRKAGVSREEARFHIERADEFFEELGIKLDTPMRKVGNRNK